MDRSSERHLTLKRLSPPFLLVIGACVQIGHGSATSAVAAARRNVCGESGGASDALCTTLGYTRVSGGYRVLIARRPPVGSDTVAVTVRGGEFTVEPVHGKS